MNDRATSHGDRPVAAGDRPVAMISGATGGLGRVLAADLAADGWGLALLGSSEERLDELIAQLELPGERGLAATADLRDAAAAGRAVEAAYERFGHVDGLAHLVGGWTGGTNVVDTADEPFVEMLDQHLWTSLNVTRALVPRMVAAGRGRIVAVTTPIAGAPEAGMGAYAVGKAAEETLFATLAQELVGTGVTVNVVRVRAIDTRQRRDDDPDKDTDKTTPEEICAAIRYLFSDAARVVNGQRIGLHSGI